MAKKETGVGQSDLPLPENGDKESVPDFPVVGIGASAGGLVALEAFFLGMPVDVEPDMAFVLVQHLAPDYKSLLTDIIQRRTRMNVCEVTEGTPLQINNIYIIPPNHDMLVKEGVLYLQEPLTPHGLRQPIDFFFRSLAQAYKEWAICIVLSGTGSEMVHRVRAI